MRIGSETITLELSRHQAQDLHGDIETLKGGRLKLPGKLFGDQDRIVDSKVMQQGFILYINDEIINSKLQ